MRYYDKKEAEELNAEAWQVALLEFNPQYVSWGPDEDYMWKKEGSSGWDAPVTKATWRDFGPWNLDDLNECVNFYFEVRRESEECSTCGGSGYHPDALTVVNSFYEYQCEGMGLHRSFAWHDKITEDEAQVLIAHGRAKEGETAETINRQERERRGTFGTHDAINRMLLIKQRLERLGLPNHCPTCNGNGYVYTAPDARVSLVLWMLHPRKGCSRGVRIETIEQSDLPAVQQWLMQAAARNAERFSKLSNLAKEVNE